MKRSGILLFGLTLVLFFLPIFAEAEVLSKIKVTDKDGKVSYYDNFGSLIEDKIIFKEYEKRPGLYYPVLKNTPVVGDIIMNDKSAKESGIKNIAGDWIWVEFDVIPTLMEGEYFGKGMTWFLGHVNVPVQFVYEMEPKLKFAVAVENEKHALISIYKINAKVGRDEKIFLTFFNAINSRTPLRVAGWLYAAMYSIAPTKKELYSGYFTGEVVGFEPVYVVPMWWKKENADTTIDSRGLNVQAP